MEEWFNENITSKNYKNSLRNLQSVVSSRNAKLIERQLILVNYLDTWNRNNVGFNDDAMNAFEEMLAYDAKIQRMKSFYKVGFLRCSRDNKMIGETLINAFNIPRYANFEKASNSGRYQILALNATCEEENIGDYLHPKGKVVFFKDGKIVGTLPSFYKNVLKKGQGKKVKYFVSK